MRWFAKPVCPKKQRWFESNRLRQIAVHRPPKGRLVSLRSLSEIGVYVMDALPTFKSATLDDWVNGYTSGPENRRASNQRV